MKIKNEYIKIKQGEKEVTLNNYIYDSYLSLFSTTQYNVNDERIVDLVAELHDKQLNTCYIKFDEPLQDITNATVQDFEVRAFTKKINFTTSNNKINILYDYDFNRSTDISTPTGLWIDINDYIGRKITALGFGGLYNIHACLDVSNYDIYILEDENLTLTRMDTINSEATCVGYDFPVHLSPIGDYDNAVFNPVVQGYETKWAKIYSVGFAKTLGTFEEEYVIDEDIDLRVESDTSFGFNLKKGDMQTIFPRNDLYASNNVFPLPLYIQTELYPRTSLYCDNDLYPSDSNYKYIVFKYRLYLIHWEGEDETTGYIRIKYLDEYYSMYIPNTTKGLFEIVEKIERSDD